jgi:hypothetical protein
MQGEEEANARAGGRSGKAERSRATSRYTVTRPADLDHRAVGMEIARADTREAPLLLAVGSSSSALLLLGSFYTVQFSALLGVLGIVLGGLGTWVAVELWRSVARSRAWNQRGVVIVYGLRAVDIEDRSQVETLTFAEASKRPEITRWRGLRDLMRVRELHGRMDPQTPERLVLEWLAMTGVTFETAGPAHLLWRGRDEAPRWVSDEDLAGVDGPPYRVEVATDLGGERRPRLDRLPKRVEGRGGRGGPVSSASGP